MKKLKIFIVLFFSIIAYSNIQAQDSTEILKEELIAKENIIDSLESIITTNSKRINQLEHSGEIFIDSNEERGYLEFFFPSIIAIVVALIAFLGTIYTGKRQRESSERIITNQINAGKENALLEFRQNVLSTNRQNWINELRDIITEAITIIDSISIRRSLTHKDYRIITQLLLKAELMLNPKKDKNFIKALQDLNIALLNLLTDDIESDALISKRQKVIDKTKVTLKTEWERVKKGE